MSNLKDRIDACQAQLDFLREYFSIDSVWKHDEDVFDHLDEGDIVTRDYLERLYRDHGRLAPHLSVENRVMWVLTSNLFEYHDTGKWRYVGPPDDEDDTGSGK